MAKLDSTTVYGNLTVTKDILSDTLNATTNLTVSNTSVVLTDDSRLSDARTPTAHAMDSATYHTSSDITTLNATTSKHGFLPKLGSGTVNYLRADGTWATPPGTTSGTVTSVSGTSPVVSSGGNTPAISLATAYGDTKNPYASKTAKYFLAAPNASNGVPSFRAIIASDIPTLNQSTTGTAASLSTGGGQLILAATENYHTSTALSSLSTGDHNIAIGYNAGDEIAATNYSILLGYQAGENINATNSIAIGYNALRGDETTAVTGTDNVVIGTYAGEELEGTAEKNVIIGAYAGRYMGTGERNVAIGYAALMSLSGSEMDASDYNIGIGHQAGYSISSGAMGNIFMGYNAGYYFTSSDYNIFIGNQAGNGVATDLTGSYNVAMGYRAGYILQGAAGYNTMIGYMAGHTATTGTNNTIIGSNVTVNSATDSNKVLIGGNGVPLLDGDSAAQHLTINGTFKVVTDGGSNVSAVYVDSSGLFTNMTSSREFKNSIIDLKDPSWIYKLRPVQFEYNDLPGDVRIGLIAEEVEEIESRLVLYKDNVLHGVHYDRLMIPVLKEVQSHEEKIKQLETRVEELEAQLRTIL